MNEPKVLATATDTAVIDAPLSKIDIADWLMHLPDAEYRRCAPGQHIAAGVTTTDDGRPMSINVEQIGASVIVQHYVCDVLGAHRCLLVSLSDSITPRGMIKVGVTWELIAEPHGNERSIYTNKVTAHATDEFIAFIDEAGVTFDQAAAERGAAVAAHNRLETTLYAKSIERKALGQPTPTEEGHR